MKIFLRIVSAAVAALFFVSCSGRKTVVEDVFSATGSRYVIVITKKDFTLEVWERDNGVVASFRIGYGSNPDMAAKMHEGDRRTPEGIYTINEILSMDADRSSPAYLKLRGMNKVYFRALNGHSKFREPQRDLGDNAYGPRFYGLDYPAKRDRELYRKRIESGVIASSGGRLPGIGSGIGIHGNNDIKSIGNLSSMGCIRMYNEDVIELEQYIRLGTPVIIMAH